MKNDDFDDLFGEAARSYNAPPTVPREAMWEAISRARAESTITPITTAPSSRTTPRWLISAVGIAAVLVVGIAIGRATRGPAATTHVATHVASPAVVDSTNLDSAPVSAERAPEAGGAAESPSSSTERGSERASLPRRVATHAPSRSLDVSGDDGAFRLAVIEHLTRTEVLLTGFRAQTHNNTDAKVDAQFATLSKDLLSTTRILLSRRTDDPVLTRLLQDLELVLMQLSQYAADGRRGDADAINQSIEKRNVLPKLRSTIPAGTALLSGT